MLNETLNYTEYSFMYIEIDNFREKSQIPAITILTLLFIFGISLNAISVKVILHSKKIEIISILILNLIYLTLIWLVGILFSIPLLLYIELGKTIDDKYACGLHINENEHFILLSIRFILIFLLPFTIILVSSIKLILYLKKNNTVLKPKQKLISERKKSNVQTKNKRIKKKAIKIVLSIVLMFLIQWLPFRIGIYMFLINLFIYIQF